MKKLLALILCVVMVLSLAPMAFADADQPFPTSDADAKWYSTSAAKKVVSNAKKNIEYMYGGLAADEAVFGTIKAMDSIVVDLAKGMFEGIDEYTYVNGGVKWYISNSTLVDNTKAVLRNVIGGEVADYMNKHASSYIDGASIHYEFAGENRLFSSGVTNTNTGYTFYTTAAGDIYAKGTGNTWYLVDTSGTPYTTAAETIEWLADAGAGRFTQINPANGPAEIIDYRYDPIKYANSFATAVTKALSSEKGAANLSAYMYTLMQMKVAKEVDDKLDDFWTSVRNWEDGTAILDAYGFAEASMDPYAFIDPYNVPKATMDVSEILTPAARDYWLPIT